MRAPLIEESEEVKHHALALYDALKEKAKHNVCDRCGGKGRLAHQGHVMGGVCFKCKGKGKVWNQAGRDAIALRDYYRTYYQPARGTERETEEARNLASMLRKLGKTELDGG